ncbi:MAG: NAD(P)H-binding protein [Cyanobacteria bacterium P01_F01_bin.153]
MVSSVDKNAGAADSGNSATKRILMLGGTGTIGRATVGALVARGYQVVCIARPKAGVGRKLTQDKTVEVLQGAEVRFGDVKDKTFLAEQIFQQDGQPQNFDAVVSCMASRTGEPDDAWAIDYQAQANVLALAKESGVTQMVLLSAICVQKPLLVFQDAKLALEKELQESGLTYSIVRPTAFFKSLAGQVERVKNGKAFLTFGDGTLTACKPISDGDLANYIADCLEKPSLQNKILPIGGPGPALTQREQGEILFKLVGREPKFKSVPSSLLSRIAAVMDAIGKVIKPVAAKAELARIGHYYATESMLVWDPENEEYDADATPETGTETLADYFKRLVEGNEKAERVDVAMFSD